MDPSPWPTLADAASMLGSRGIARAVIGGLAVSLRGRPRTTIDVDLVIKVEVKDALRLVRDLEATQFEPLFSGVEEVASTAFILPLRHRITGVRLDLAVGVSGFERDAIARATTVAVGQTTVPVVTVEDLLVMKPLAGRPRDDLDIRGLIGLHREEIDWNHCLAVATAPGEAVDPDVAGRLRAARDSAAT